MQIGNIFTLQEFVRPRTDILFWRHRSRTVDDAVVMTVAAQQPLRAGTKQRGHDIAVRRPFAFLRTQENRPGLGIGWVCGNGRYARVR